MNKKIIIPLIAALIIVILITVFLPFLFKTKTPTQSLTKTVNTLNTDYSVDPSIATTVEPVIQQKLPYETDDFRIEYDEEYDMVIATEKTPQASQKIDQWLANNNLTDIKNNEEIYFVDDSQVENSSVSIIPGEENNTQSLIELLSILLNFGNNPSQSTTATSPSTIDTEFGSGRKPTPTSTKKPKKKPKKKKKKNKNKKLTPTPTSTSKKKDNTPTIAPKASGDKVYYAQCGGSYDKYLLPSGCTICEAGCGPTTIAMIVASLIDKSVNPQTMVDLYKKKGYYLGCSGSGYTDAKNVLASFGLKTTDYLIFSLETIDQMANDLKNYLDSGWTIFALANYCDGGCGHFFWIVDVSANNDTWAYDPYYGRLQKPPYNEKSRYPFPKYRVAFGVKR